MRGFRGKLLAWLLITLLAAACGAAAAGLPGGRTVARMDSAAHAHPAAAVATAARQRSAAAERAVATAVRPGLVDITSMVGYQGASAAATGMVISRSGLVLTNNHAIRGATGIAAVSATTGRRYAARWVGYDQRADVAVLQLVGASGLATVPLGSSAGLAAGQPVIALGNAEGQGGAAAAAGRITRLNQAVAASEDGGTASEMLHGMVQTSAAIVPGDSGGPLIAADGRVIGMDTAADGPRPGHAAASFAIPISQALAVARRILAGRQGHGIQTMPGAFLGALLPARGGAGQASSPALQLQLQAGSDPAAAGDGLLCTASAAAAGIPAAVAPDPHGALVLGRLCGSPADLAGLAAGDVITAVDGSLVTTPGSLLAVLAQLPAGARAVISWMDPGGQTRTALVTLAQGPPQ